MNPDNLGALVCRGVGLLLLLLGLSVVFSAFFFGSSALTRWTAYVGAHSPGWTSYAPPPRPEPSLAMTLRFFVAYNLPYLLQVVAGVVLLLFSRPIGRLLARGLFDHAA